MISHTADRARRAGCDTIWSGKVLVNGHYSAVLEGLRLVNGRLMEMNKRVQRLPTGRLTNVSF